MLCLPTVLWAFGVSAGVAAVAMAPIQAQAATYQQVYAFKGRADGAKPVGQLTALNGILYGVTTLAGSKCNCGTVYRLTKEGAQRVIHDFENGPSDGAYPAGGMAVLGSTLYGTTSGGGASYGTVFQITPSGAEKLLYSFNSNNGFGPYAPESDLLARTTSVWGTLYSGSIFKTSVSGETTVFPKSPGFVLESGLVETGGIFYGTTSQGGKKCEATVTCGTVYQITPSGQVSTLYAFQGGADGVQPGSTLVALNGILYGTTTSTIFAIDKAGSEAPIAPFNGGYYAGGGGPGLTLFNGTLYGVSPTGGGTGCGGHGCGTIYAITPRLQQPVPDVLYRFQGGTDGATPNGRLFVWDGALWGVTATGGGSANCGNDGCGTVFRLIP
jgi:uncharacterized repeat protein (TIGR03803 family)